MKGGNLRTAIHISEIKNRDSISRNGLQSSKVKLDHHLSYFRDVDFLKEDEDKALYAWLDSEKNEKYIKDMIYCKYWIQPRNDFFKRYEKAYNDFFDFSNMSDIKLWCQPPSMIFDIYEIKYSEDKEEKYILDQHIHEQIVDSDKFGTCFEMDERFAHDDKPLFLSNIPQTNIKIVGQATWEMTKNGFRIKVLKNIDY